MANELEQKARELLEFERHKPTENTGIVCYSAALRTLDAAPSEPSAEHWRRAIADIFGPDMPATVERHASRLAKEGK